MLPQLVPDRDTQPLFPPHLPCFLLQSRSTISYPPRKQQRHSPIGWLPTHEDGHTSISGSSGATRQVPTASGGKGTSGSGSGNMVPSSSGTSSTRGVFFRRAAAFSIGVGAGSGALFGAYPAFALRLWPFPSRGSKGHKKDSKKSILVMMSNTGGGHKASAEALKQAIQELYGDQYTIHIVDMWKQHTPAPFSRMPDGYSFLVKHSLLWRLSYEVLQPRVLHLPYLAFFHAFMARGLNQAFNQYKPDLVVSVHPLMQHIPLRVLKSRVKQGLHSHVPFATVVTDFTTCHNTWFHKGVDKCFVATDFAKKLALRMGLQEGQVVVHGLPIRPIFSHRLPAKVVMRRRLGMDLQRPAVLLVGGGEGMGKLEATVDEIAAQLGPECQVVAVCGRNAKLLQRLCAKGSPNGLKLLATGFVDNLHEWMAAADVIVTKAGPGTIAEALISGLPILLNGNIPCQEEGNIPYVIDNKVGAFETRPAAIASLLKKWFGPGRAEFRRMAQRARELGRPEAVYKISRDLAAMIEDAPVKLRVEPLAA